MEFYLLQVVYYLLGVVKATSLQILVLLGPLIILALLMNTLAGINERLSYKLFGRGGFLYLFGWLGTAVHELSHAFFALLFGHRIHEIVLFDPNGEGGALGHVSHSWNRNSIYQNIGNFFIGIGPILFGSIILYLLTYLLFGLSTTEVAGIQAYKVNFLSLSALEGIAHTSLNGFKLYISYIFFGSSSVWWKATILIYILYAVGSSITLSPADIRGASMGFFYFVQILLIINLITVWLGDLTFQLFAYVGNLFSTFYLLILLSILTNILFIIILMLVLGARNIYKRM